MLRARIRRPDKGECQTLTEGRTVESFQKTKNKKEEKEEEIQSDSISSEMISGFFSK